MGFSNQLPATTPGCNVPLDARADVCTRPATPPLTEWTVRLLLIGPRVPWPRGVTRVDQLPADTMAEVSYLTQGGTPAIAATWRDHRDFLLAEAGRMGIRPLWPRQRFFAEAIAAQEATRRQR